MTPISACQNNTNLGSIFSCPYESCRTDLSLQIYIIHN